MGIVRQKKKLDQQIHQIFRVIHKRKILNQLELLKELQEAIRKERYYTRQIEDLREERQQKIEQFKKDIMQLRTNLDRIDLEVKFVNQETNQETYFQFR